MPSAQPAEQPTRSEFSPQLSGFDAGIQELFAAITAAVKRATAALVSGDRSEASKMAHGAGLSPPILSTVERQLVLAFAREVPVARDLRLMITALRVVPELERCLDLARHVAERAGFAEQLPADVVASFGEIGSAVAAMWESASAAWQNRDAGAAANLDSDDDEIDVLCDEVIERLGDLHCSSRVAMEARLIVRFYERLGDHAVHITERLVYLAAGPQTAAT